MDKLIQDIFPFVVITFLTFFLVNLKYLSYILNAVPDAIACPLNVVYDAFAIKFAHVSDRNFENFYLLNFRSLNWSTAN